MDVCGEKTDVMHNFCVWDIKDQVKFCLYYAMY